MAKFLVTGGAGFIGGNFLHIMVNKYPNDEYHINKIVEMSETLTCKERTKYKLYELDNTNFLFLVSHYFESLDDFINLELSVKKYQGNMKKFVFNPISVTDENIHFFPKISTLYLYNPEDQPIVSIKISNIVRNELSWFDFCKNSQKKSKKNSKQKIVYMKSDRDIDYEKGKKKNNGNEWYKHDFIISDKVEIIQKKCFFQFTKISSITLPEHIQLQRLCFSNCSFTSITFPNIHKRTELCICGNGIFTTENNVFDCLLFSLQNQIINGRKLNSLTKDILTWDFLNKDLTSLFIPSSVTLKSTEDISDESFPNLVELKCYKHHVENKHLIDKVPQLTKIEVIDGCLDNIVVSYDCHLKMKRKGIILNNINYTDEDRMIYGNKLPQIIKSVHFYSPKYYSLNEIVEKKIVVRTIDSELKEFEIPMYQTKIYDNMFGFNSILTNIKCHDEIKEIGEECFCECFELKSISIPSSVTSIGKKCFYKCCSLESIDYNGEIDGNCIEKCRSLNSIPKIKSLKPGIFNDFNYLKSIQLNDSIEKIPIRCFEKCLSLEEINIETPPETEHFQL